MCGNVYISSTDWLANVNVEYANASTGAQLANFKMIHLFENRRALCTLNVVYHSKT